MTPNESQTRITWLLAATSALAFFFIFLIPPSISLFQAFTEVRQTGLYPDGLSMRRTYIGIPLLDEILTGLAGFFSAATDGRDIAAHRFCLWLVPQLCGILVFIYWEAGKAERGLVRFPTLVAILAQLTTAGVVLPLYFIAHVQGIPVAAPILPSDAVPRAKSLMPAIVIGYLLPSAMLFLAPESVTLDTRQIIAAIWQPFPIYIAILHTTFSFLYQFTPSQQDTTEARAKEKIAAFLWLKRSYLSAATISMAAHWTIMIPSLFSTHPSTSFARVFIPYILHPYLPVHVAPPSLPAYRLPVLLLFQHDWLFLTTAGLVFFGWYNRMVSGVLRSPANFQSWLMRLTLVIIVGGPGLAFALEAIGREAELLESPPPFKDGSVGESPMSSEKK